MINSSNGVLGFSNKMPNAFIDAGVDRILSSGNTPGFKVSRYNSSSLSKITLMPPLLKALMIYLEQPYSENPCPPAALGQTTDGEWFCEMQKEHITLVAVYNPKTGEIRAGAKDNITHKLKDYAVFANGPAMSDEVAYMGDGTLIMYLLLGVIMSDAEAMMAIEVIENRLSSGDSLKDVQAEFGVLCDNVYRRAVTGSADKSALINVVDVAKTGAAKKISGAKLENGKYVINETIKGTFSLVKHGSISGSFETTLEKKDTSLGIKFNPAVTPFILSDEQMSHYVPRQNTKNILKMLKAGKEDSALKISNFFFIGPPGSGKSEDARAIAYYAEMPFYVMCLSSGITEENLKGFIEPSLKSDELLSEDEKEIVASVTDLFPSDLEIDLTPEKAYEKLLNTSKKGVSAFEVYAEAYSKLLSYAENASRPIESNDEGLSYRFLPSPLVLAAKFGGIVEIQEPSSVSDPTVLTCLNEFMNKADGVLDTPNGSIRRHENCYIIMTDNYSTDIGNSAMNQAVKDRAGTVTLWYERADKSSMVSMAKKSGITIKDDILNVMAQVIEVVDTEAQKMDNSIKAVAGYRSFLPWAKCVQMGFSVIDSMNMCVINKMATNPEERELLIDIVENNTRINEY